MEKKLKKGDFGQLNPDPKQNFQVILLTFTDKNTIKLVELVV